MKADLTRSFNMDCIEFMKEVPDKFYDLAVVDPPYGIGESKRKSYHANANTLYSPKKWDNNVPDQHYFNELFRISKNQIIWGGNYFNLPICIKPIIWDKKQPEGIDQAMFEMAWNSNSNIQAKIFRRSPSADKNVVSNGCKRSMSVRKRIHPTQKPVKLYEWILINYAKEGDKILDTHGGSQSSRIACYNLGFPLDIIELDKDYYDQGNKRFEQHKKQLTIF